jgi:hypothetical protein
MTSLAPRQAGAVVGGRGAAYEPALDRLAQVRGLLGGAHGQRAGAQAARGGVT